MEGIAVVAGAGKNGAARGGGGGGGGGVGGSVSGGGTRGRGGGRAGEGGALEKLEEEVGDEDTDGRVQEEIEEVDGALGRG